MDGIKGLASDGFINRFPISAYREPKLVIKVFLPILTKLKCGKRRQAGRKDNLANLF